MKKNYLSLIFLLVSLLFCFACTPPSTPIVTDDPNALTIMGKKTDMEKTYMQRLFHKYEEDTGKKLKIIEYEDEEYERKAAEQFAKGNIPDIFMHFHNSDLNAFDAEENFYRLNDESWVDDLTDSAKAYCLDDSGNLLGLPFWESSVSGCYYNKTLLKEWGIENLPPTQEKFDSLCHTILDKGKTPIMWPGQSSWMIQFALDPLFALDPADPDDKSGLERLAKLNSNDISFAEIPEVYDMVQWIQNASKNFWFGKDCVNKGWDDISTSLASEETVMTFIWDTWFYTDFKPGKYTKDDFALMPIFMNTAPTYEGGNLNMMMVNKNGKKLEEALNFLEYCATKENYNYAFDGISTVACFKGMTANIQSRMVTERSTSIAKYERVSTAATKIIGYSADAVAAIIRRLMVGEISVEECVQLMDEDRKLRAKEQGAAGF